MVEKKTSRYSPEFHERAVRLLDEHRSDYPSISAACREIGGKPGCSGDSLHDWWKQARRPGTRHCARSLLFRQNAASISTTLISLWLMNSLMPRPISSRP
ncbi:transposase [Komagataeibacter intermedius AF2]|uniref:Transposase n=1 Tax=Komagataeibacter intermedius AF2 TaxID=1458464 RepID=A0A0N0MDF6_9PROT|nr:transposase [Komagataeibacter intermedius AF2]